MADSSGRRGTRSGVGAASTTRWSSSTTVGRRRPRTASVPPMLSLPGGHGKPQIDSWWRRLIRRHEGRKGGQRGDWRIGDASKAAQHTRFILARMAVELLPARIHGGRDMCGGHGGPLPYSTVDDKERREELRRWQRPRGRGRAGGAAGDTAASPSADPSVLEQGRRRCGSQGDGESRSRTTASSRYGVTVSSRRSRG
jgi:hypothetical protein